MPSPRRRRAKAQKGKIVQSLKYQKWSKITKFISKKVFPQNNDLTDFIIGPNIF